MSRLGQEPTLQSAVKALNDFIGPKGLVPYYLVFGTFPRYTPSGIDPNLPVQRERHKDKRLVREDFT